VGPLPLREGTRSFSAVLAAGPVGCRLGNDVDKSDAVAILGANLVLCAAMRAPHVRASGILTQMKDLDGAEELRAAKAFDRRIADPLLCFLHVRFTSQDTRREEAFRASSPHRAIVRRERAAVQSRALRPAP